MFHPAFKLITYLYAFCKMTELAHSAIINTYQSEPVYVDNQIYYEYRYTIEDALSGVVSDRWESRLGNYVKGRYSFLDADGMVRSVNYEVDGPKGFHAIVQSNPPATKFKSRQEHLDDLQNRLDAS